MGVPKLRNTMKIKPLPSQEYLLDCFEHIGPHLIWLESPVEHFETWKRMEWFNYNFSGTIAGTNSNGYIRIKLDNQKYLAHRIVYKIHTGIEANIIDHKNRIKYDNRFENLRSCTQADNNRNNIRCLNSKSGHINIHKKRDSWVVSDWLNGKIVHVGVYQTLEEAIQAKKDWDAI